MRVVKPSLRKRRMKSTGSNRVDLIPGKAGGFTLIEVLTVTAVIALVAAVLLPSLQQARKKARIVKTHADLRQVTFALDAYYMNNKNSLPPVRQDCSTQISHQLPIELATTRFLPLKKIGGIPMADMEDEFNPGQTYKYKAPGALYQNGRLSPTRKSEIYVPDDFPKCVSENGEYYDDPKKSPARYAVWSVGPDLKSPKFDIINIPRRIPLHQRFWCMHPGDTGVITHMKARKGLIFMSP